MTENKTIVRHHPKGVENEETRYVFGVDGSNGMDISFVCPSCWCRKGGIK